MGRGFYRNIKYFIQGIRSSFIVRLKYKFLRLKVQHNEKLSQAHIVFRLAGHTASDGSVSLGDFVLSTGDKEEAAQTGDPPYLSVWSKTVTEIKQALSFASSPKYNWACKMRVSEIASIEIMEPSAPFPHLGVYWKRLEVSHPPEEIDIDCQIAILGHAGIVGLHKPKSIPRAPFKLALKKLHELASKGAIPLVPFR